MMTPACKRQITEGVIKKSKMVDGDRGGHLKQKSQDVLTSTRKEGDDDALDDMEEERKNVAELKLPEVIGISLNLSKKNLKVFPEALLDKMTNVQYVYLEGNKLTVLPQDFFQRLHWLKWLDLRNNSLTTLPTLGLKNHTSLEIVLLQGNRIRNLPAELASIPSLKGLQITGNPIANVPGKVIEGGFQEVMKYLKKIFTEDEVLLPVSETILVKPSTSRDCLKLSQTRESCNCSLYCTKQMQFPIKSNEPDTIKTYKKGKFVLMGRINDSKFTYKHEVDEPKDAELRMWDLDKLSQWRQAMKKRSENLTKNTNDKPILQQPKISVSLRSHPKLVSKPQPFRCGVYNRNRHRPTASALRYFRMRKTRLGYRRRPISLAMIQEKAMREAHRAQVRETLEKQARKIQRMRDKEVLKSWRDHARVTRHQMKLLDNYQQYPSKDFMSKTPFDVDPEFLSMLNRVDLYRSLKDYDNKSRRAGKPRVRITAVDLERQMNEVMKKLQQLDTDDSGDNNSPRTKRSHMCDRMYKIMDIQKTLKSLQTLNSSMNGIVPIIKPKSKN